MSKSVQEHLIDVAPLTQVLFALGSGLGLIAGSLPEAEFERALGLPAAIPGLTQIDYSDYGGFGRFVPTLIAAIFGDPFWLWVMFLLCLVAGAAFLLAREDAVEFAQLSAAIAQLGAQPGSGEVSSGRWRHSSAAAWFVVACFVGLAVSEVLSYPRFVAPTRLTNLAVRLEPPSSFDAGFWNGGPQHARLYGAFFGLPVDGATVFPAAPDFGTGGSLPATVRHSPHPTQADLDYLFAYYDGLAIWTVVSLLALVTLTMLASVILRRTDGGALQWLAFAGISLVTFCHLLQWTHLAYAYGRLYLPTLVIERAVKTTDPAEFDESQLAEEERGKRWPFATPRILRYTDKERLGVPADVLAVANYWPLRPEGTSGVVLANCRAAGNAQDLEGPWTLSEATPSFRTDGVTFFENVPLTKLINLCDDAEENTIQLFDGYGNVAEIKKDALEEDLENAELKQ